MSQPEEAMTWLKKAIDLDASLRQLAQTEPDLISLHEQEGFKALLNGPS